MEIEFQFISCNCARKNVSVVYCDRWFADAKLKKFGTTKIEYADLGGNVLRVMILTII